jgi:hypothetical protein
MDYTEVPFDFLVQLAATDKLAQAEIERRLVIGLASKKSLKHGDHDQSDHGNRDGAGVSSAPQTFSEVLSLATGTKDGGELLTKVLEARGVSMKPQLAKLTGEDRIYRGVTTDEAARSFLSGEAPMMGGYPMGDDGRLEPYTWGAGFYATTEREEAVSYRGDNGRVIEMEFSPGAKIVRGEAMWDQVPGMPDDWSKQEWGQFNGTISDLKNAYWASQGYDAIDLGREIVILNPAAIIADVSTAEAVGVDSGRKSPFDKKSLKHADHDQSEHGSWADDSGAEKEGRERRDPWEGSLITREKAYEVVNYYTGRGYNDINRHLRGTDAGANDADIEEKIDAMDAAFFRAPMSSEDRTVYRGVSPNIGRELLAGETFRDKGYTSTTTDMSVTEDFTSYSDGSKYVMEITIPSGTQFIEVEESSEKEIILNKGSRFSIDEVREEGDYKIIVATLLTGYQGKSKSLKHLDGDHDQSEHGSWATGITGGKKLPAAEFAAKVVARAAESRGGESGVQKLDLSNTSSFAEIKSASDKITEAIDKEMGKWPSMYAEPRVEPTEQQKFLKQFSDGADLMRNTLHSANEGAIGRNKDFQFFVATGVDGTTPVGTLVYRNFTRENVGNNPYLTGHEDKWMELTNIGTNGLEPGVGTRLVTQVLGAAAESGRGVWLNDPYDEAAGFYKELGFEMKYKQGDWIGYMEPEAVQEWWKSYEAAGGK